MFAWITARCVGDFRHAMAPNVEIAIAILQESDNDRLGCPFDWEANVDF